MKISSGLRVSLMQDLIQNKVKTSEVVKLLGVTGRTIRRLKKKFLGLGPEGLKDHRKSNYCRLTGQQIREICDLKLKGPWRSARYIRDKLTLPVHPKTVWWILAKNNLTHLNTRRLKPLQRFAASSPNELWQTDIMGKIDFPNLGVCYLIATLDDHSRFGLSAKWFRTQRKINVFNVWYNSLAGWGVPAAMLQDRGSQYKARTDWGQADYQFYADALKIKLIWAQKARTKGKIERFWRFVQRDFVRENLEVPTLAELNQRFNGWMYWYNYQHQPVFLGGRTRTEVYQPSVRREAKVDLKTLLIIDERRRVNPDSTISLYGVNYRVPLGYIGCRIWVKIIGNKLYFESMGEIFYKTRLKLK